jgi:hypothetical protein
MGMKDVRITVMNVNEAGKLVLSPEQPDNGMPVVATVEDPDGVVTITNWRWARAATMVADFAAAMGTDGDDEDEIADGIIQEATTNRWTGEVGDFLWAMVEYRDGHNDDDDPITATDERNYGANSALLDLDVDGDSDRMEEAGAANAVQTAPATTTDPTLPTGGFVELARTVYENVPSTGYVGLPIEDVGARNMVGGPDGATFVFAERHDGTEANDNDAGLYYDEVLQGPLVPADDTVTPAIPEDPDGDDKMGQLALAPVTHLDFEGVKNTYVVEISDPDTEVDLSIYRVTITVMDVNEPPSAPSELKGLPPVLNTAPMFAATSTSLSVDENAAAGTVVGMVTATDADRGDQETLMYSLDDGADAGSFAIDSATGEITTTAMLDYEMQDSYMVTVTATDDDEATDMIYVTIMVNNLGLDTSYDDDESGTIDSAEVLAAVRDYFAGGIDATEVLKVVGYYFAGL